MTKEEYYKLRDTCANNRWNGYQNQTYGWWLQTHILEFWDMLEEANTIDAKIFLEIGTNHGGSAVFWDHQAGPTGQVITVDHYLLRDNGIGTTMFNKEHCDYKPVSAFTQMYGDSHSPETLERIKNLLKGPVDFLFIDGDHSYEGCKMDYQMYAPLVRPGGIIAIDDCVLMPDHVGRFWREIEGTNTKMLPIPEPGGHGVGIVYI